MKRLRYRVGIDVGLRGVGVAAIEIDDSNPDFRSAIPKKLLNLEVYLHDGGVFDESEKQTRKAKAGVVRRTQNRYKRRRRQLHDLDNYLKSIGLPVEQAQAIASAARGGSNPLIAWYAREEAATHYIEDQKERELALALSIRHIARHRGWKNPYSSVRALGDLSKTPSSFYEEFLNRVKEYKKNNDLESDARGDKRKTVAQILVALFDKNPQLKIRGLASKGEEKESLSLGKLHQSDYYWELKTILEMQKVPQDEQEKILTLVFEQKNPKEEGAAAERVAPDDLQPQFIRASKASIAFQQYRILAVITNLRIRSGETERRLSKEEIVHLYGFLSSDNAVKDDVSWLEVAEQLSIERSNLKGIGGEDADGNPVSNSHAPVIETYAQLNKSFKKSPTLKKWWEAASEIERELFIMHFDNAGIPSYYEEEYETEFTKIREFIASLSEEEQTELDKIALSSGRAAYSIETLLKLKQQMLATGQDVYEARKELFHIPADWKPQPNPLGKPVGNPAVDRVIKFVARWLKACEKKWGAPISVNIEHGKEGFKSDKVVRDTKRKQRAEQKKRYEANQKIIADFEDEISNRSLSSDYDSQTINLKKCKVLQRQNSKCLYCGTKIAYQTAQMDHIVSRKTVGASSAATNLVATCAECNQAKGNQLFSQWADAKRMKETINRVNEMIKDGSMTQGAFKKFKKEIIARLKQTEEDDPIDSRSIESVSWMARELRKQIEGYFGWSDKPISSTGEITEDNITMVFNGFVTASARRASGIEKALNWIGGAKSKDRLDRRHHAIDAAVIAMLRPAVATTLMQQNELKRNEMDEQEFRRKNYPVQWKDYTGSTPAEISLYRKWKKEQMPQLKELLQIAMEDDRIPLLRDKRLGINNGTIHKATIEKAAKRKLGDALSVAAINKAPTKVMWRALTELPEYDEKTGLPANKDRIIKIAGKAIRAEDMITFASPESNLDKDNGVAYALVRGGVAEIGESIHHFRFYKIRDKKKKDKYFYAMVRVFTIDLLQETGDLFTCQLEQDSISWRMAPKKLRDAYREGRVQYLTWAVKGDEIQVNPEKFKGKKGSYSTLLTIPEFSEISRFYLVASDDDETLILRTLLIAGEGIESYLDTHNCNDKQEKDLKTLNQRGWRVSVNVLFKSRIHIIRRSTLGYIRRKSNNHMPISWWEEE